MSNTLLLCGVVKIDPVRHCNRPSQALLSAMMRYVLVESSRRMAEDLQLRICSKTEEEKNE